MSLARPSEFLRGDAAPGIPRAGRGIAGLVFVALVLAVGALTLTPGLPIGRLGLPSETLYLVGHAIAFLALGIAGAAAWGPRGSVIAGLAGLAAGVELGQFLVPGRSPGLVDFTVSLAGALLGWSAMRVGVHDRFLGGATSNVFRGMATLAMGTAAGRIIGVAAMPALTRIYGPEHFGVLSVFTSLALMLVPLITLRYVVAVPLPRTDAMAMNLMALCGLLMAGMTVALALMLWGFGPALLELVSMETLVPWWWLIVLGVAGMGGYELLTMWGTRQRAYGAIARSQVLQSATGEAIKIGLGLLGLKPLGLLIGQITTQAGGIASLFIRFWEDFRRHARQVSLRRAGLAARRYRGFPIYRLPSQFLLMWAQHFPLLGLAALFGAGVAGQFGLALMAVRFPMDLVSSSISRAYYAEISRAGSLDQVRRLSFGLLRRMPVFALPPMIFLALLGPQAFEIVFGATWLTAGEFARLMAIYVGAAMTAIVFSTLMNVVDRQAVYLITNAVRFVLVTATFLLARQLAWSAHETVLAYSLLMLVFHSGNVLWFLAILERKANE